MFSRAITLGRIAAIPIRLHWSWLIIFSLLVAALRPIYAQRACATLAPCGSDFLLAALMAVLVGVSVLLHELGHALMAQRFRVPVQSITLFAFGGVAEVEAESPTPGAEFAIAVAGPAASLVIAASTSGFWWLAGGLNSSGPLAALVVHVALANTIMALFNLLPGYPMDGGRVLRAVLWFLNDDLLPATRAAAQVGRACGVSLGLGGIVLALAAGQPLVALWTAVVGMFLYRTASASYRQLLLQTALRGVHVADLMQRRLRTVSRDLTLEQFVARYLLGQAETGFAVVEPPEGDNDPLLLGMITLRNLRPFTTGQWANRQVGEAMTPARSLTALTPQLTAFDALYALNDSPDGLLPVTEDGYLVGLLRRRDVALFVQVQMARRR